MARILNYSFMSRTAITLKFKMCLFLDEASYWAEKLLTDINLPPLMPDADSHFEGSLGLDFRKWWHHVQPNNTILSNFSVFHQSARPLLLLTTADKALWD